MASSFEDIIPVLTSMLTADEQSNGVLYAVGTVVPAGSQLKFPGITLPVPWDAFLAFIDRQPLANWGHSARYIIVNPQTREALSYETRLPPFQPGPGSGLLWKVLYKAPSVPDAVVHKQ